MIRLCLGNVSIIYHSTTKCRSKRCAQFAFIARLSVIVNCCWLDMIKYWVNLLVFYLLKLTKKCFTMNHKKGWKYEKECVVYNMFTGKCFNSKTEIFLQGMKFTLCKCHQTPLTVQYTKCTGDQICVKLIVLGKEEWYHFSPSPHFYLFNFAFC